MALPTQTPRRISGGILAIVLCLASMGLTTLWSYEGGSSTSASGTLHSLRSAVHTLTTPFDQASSVVSVPVDALTEAASDALASPQTLSELRRQNEEMAATIMRLEEYRLENERLSELLKIADAYSLEATAAHILRRSTDSWNQVITIDKGTRDGLAVGMPVMSPNGLIGQIESVSTWTAQVRLLTDQNSGVAVFLQANRSEGVVTGSLSATLYLSYMPLNINVVVGDVVITSGAGGVYPKGIVVGEVTSVEYSPSDVYQTIVVKPSARIKNYEEVLVLVGRQAEVQYNESVIAERAGTALGVTTGNTGSEGAGSTGAGSNAGAGSDSAGNSTGAGNTGTGNSTGAAAEGGN